MAIPPIAEVVRNQITSMLGPNPTQATKDAMVEYLSLPFVGILASTPGLDRITYKYSVELNGELKDLTLVVSNAADRAFKSLTAEVGHTTEFEYSTL
ncbi:MAG: hypothetical protein SP1CHLAM54_12460 [Chlamydiia bacterium]|nr:hypothetical protein [Chlamydiia bacterium]MCH9616144.1 hypothetical protein [Chlamydiia bacterium]MCH9629870.1 hypothetical protein [Chlamydiia bacterium]